MWTPAETQAVFNKITGSHASEQPVGPARIEVTNETTLAAARRLVTDDPGTEAGQPIGCLNFASAKNLVRDSCCP
jgi:hypothetical protein